MGNACCLRYFIRYAPYRRELPISDVAHPFFLKQFALLEAQTVPGRKGRENFHDLRHPYVKPTTKLLKILYTRNILFKIFSKIIIVNINISSHYATGKKNSISI